MAGDRAGISWDWGDWVVGTSLDLVFLLSLAVVLRPQTVRELFILGAAAISPMAVYALERANNDLAVSLLVICGAIVFNAPRPFRLFSYGLFVAADLLKYYPLVLLALIARERRRDALVTAVAAGFTLILFGVAFFRTENSANEHPHRILVFHRRLLRPEPTVRVWGSSGRGAPPGH